MRLVIAPWITHDGGAIYSIDFHPSSPKLATCGQGNVGGNGVVIIWDTRPLSSEKDCADPQVPRLLAKIQHQAGVNCVRWSPKGDLLASASDDKVVTIYEYGGRVKSSGTIGSKDVVTVEKYRIAHNMHNHSMEVLSVEWSPEGRYLASSSMDNTVIIWNAKKLPERIAVLDSSRDGHNAPVKGVSWDPIGKYIATQSADKTVKVWTCDNWQCEQTVDEPFNESGQTTMFSRLGWTAEGQFLIAPCAMNNQGPVAQVIRRKDWDTSIDLVGHRKAVTAVRVCPKLFKYSDYTGKELQVSLLAVGSRDKSLSVWVFPLVKRPVVVLNRIFKHSIMDITWRGLELAVCSQDGSIKYFAFNKKEVGEILNNEQMAVECESLYKQRPSQFCDEFQDLCDTPGKLQSSFIDSAEMLMAKKKNDEAPTVPKQSFSEKIEQAKKKTETLLTTHKEQLETVTKDGKRRIQPIFLASTSDDTPAPTTSAQPAPIKPTKAIHVPSSPKKARVEFSTDDSTAESSDEEMETSEDEASTGKEDDIPLPPKPEKPPTAAQSMMVADFKKPALRSIDRTHVVVSDVNTILDVPEQRATMTEGVVGVPTDFIEINNDFVNAQVTTSRLTYSKNKQPTWSAFIGPPVAIAVANRFWTVVGCYDRAVRVFSSASGRLQCALQLDSSPVRLGLNSHKMFALTQSGKLSTWDVDKCKALVSKQPIADCVSKDAYLSSISLTVTGLPILSFSTGNLFTYSIEMQCWHLIDSSAAVLRLSDSIDTSELGDGPLGRVLKKRTRATPILKVPSVIRSSVTENQLETWLVSSQVTASSADYKRILVTYVQQLVRNKSLLKIKETLNRLQGAGTISGLSKSALLKDVEEIIKTDPVLAGAVIHKQQSIL